MRLVIEDNSKGVSEWAAKYVMKRINEFRTGPERYFVLGLPTGQLIQIRHYIRHLGAKELILSHLKMVKFS